MFHDELGEYRWIQVEGSRRVRPDGNELLYVAYSDVTEQRRLKQYFQNTLKNLPGGVVVVGTKRMGASSPSISRKGLRRPRRCPLEDTWRLYREDA